MPLTRALFSKLREALVSVLPVTLIVIILYFTPLVWLTSTELIVFIISSLGLILGIALFNLGADMAMTPMGEHTGAGLTRSGSLALLLGVCFLMGLFITIAEPDLTVLASQVSGLISETTLVVTVGVGVGIFLILCVLKIVFQKSLASLLMYFYMILFALASMVLVVGGEGFLAIAFDSGGVTTGPITVPFIMALGVGIAATIGGKNASENSFGLIAMCSVGPILAVLLLGSGARGELNYSVPDYSVETRLDELLPKIIAIVKEVAIALGLIVIFFMILQLVYLKLPKRLLGRIAVGIGYTFVGLVIFLTAVTVGFMPVGYRLGTELSANSPAVLIGFGFIIGFVTVLAEPAVHVLNKQVEELTGGTVSRTSMLAALSIGVGISIALSMLRIVFEFNILYYLIPGYLISLGLSFFVPGLYTAIAFDSGGVASGPLTSSFILPLAVGVCVSLHGEASVLTDAFGIVAMVALTPLITIQLLGFRAVMRRRISERVAMRRMLESDDEQIIEFM